MITCSNGHEIDRVQRTITLQETSDLDADGFLDRVLSVLGDDVIDSTDWEAYCASCDTTYDVATDDDDRIIAVTTKVVA